MRWFSLPRHNTVAAYTALALAVGSGTAYAATNGYVQLGKTNTEFTATTIQRATAGAALAIRVDNGYAPFTVNSRKQVSNLNATYVGGKPATSLQTKINKLQWHALNLDNGWVNYNGGVRTPAWAVDVQGVVHFRGAIRSGTGAAFVLPTALRPTTTVWLTADQFAAATGRIYIETDGSVYVQSDPSYSSYGAAFTSLDGITYTP